MRSFVFMTMLAMLATLAPASAKTVNLVNNCDVDVEISLIYIPTGSEIECRPMLRMASGDQIEIDNFHSMYESDGIIIKSLNETDHESFTLIDTLQNVMSNAEDVDGTCTDIVNFGGANVYAVEPEASYLTLCARI
jgi:hypothetical protein